MPMDPADILLLVVLGTADSGPTTLDEITAAARLVAPFDWHPTAEVIRASAEGALRDGLVVVVDRTPAPGARLETTAAGRARIKALLRKPVPRLPGGFARTCLSLKVCFLHALPQPERGSEGRTLAQLYRDTIRRLRRLQRLPRPLGGAALDDLRCEIASLESELAWLDGMNAWRPLRQAAE